MGSVRIFETQRLIVREFKLSDTTHFFDMMGNPNVMHPIPQKTFTKEESDQKLKELISFYKAKSGHRIWAIDLKGKKEMIGLCGFLRNKEMNHEMAYRLREKFWRFGYGTEIAKGLIHYALIHLALEFITADVQVSNMRSIKILEKFMSFDKEFYNQTDQCTDRRYKLYKKDWLPSGLS